MESPVNKVSRPISDKVNAPLPVVVICALKITVTVIGASP